MSASTLNADPPQVIKMNEKTKQPGHFWDDKQCCRCSKCGLQWNARLNACICPEREAIE